MYVYKHTNRINGKVYIGITKNRPSKRWKGGEGYKLVKGDFYKDIQKYGWGLFDHEVLFEGLSYDEAIKKERELVIKYRSNDPEYGYNQTQGGRSGIYGSKNGASRPVVMIKDGEIMEFECAADGARYVGGHRSNITNCCKGIIKTAYGCKWEYK